jgi:phenylpropionate dioxygenase-like ring-hydroxylating dioxygenase large terminal subunit
MAVTNPRFPFPMPYGWFSLGRLDELPSDPVATVRAFDQDVVIWRDGDSRHVVGATCPHMGAHLGVGGEVVDGCIRCPFHHWAYDGEGHNVNIPYADRPNRKARLKSFPVREANGHLLVWYHPEAAAPLFEVPHVLTDEHKLAGGFDRRVNSAWQEIAENSVDMAHFKFIHGMGQIAEVGELTIDGPFRQVRSKQLFNSARGAFEGNLTSNSFGPGVGAIDFELLGTVTLISAITPVDDCYVDVRFTFYHSGDPMAEKISAGFSAEVERQFDQDIPIWESKSFVPSPALAPSEKAVTVFRKWASQFYADVPA